MPLCLFCSDKMGEGQKERQNSPRKSCVGQISGSLALGVSFARVVETLRHALNVLAVVAPDWLQGQVQSDRLERYGHRAEEFPLPKGVDKCQLLLRQVGQDGWGLLAAIESDLQSHWMLSIPAVDTLQRVWKQDYLPLGEGGTWIADEDRLEAAKLFFSLMRS